MGNSFACYCILKRCLLFYMLLQSSMDTWKTFIHSAASTPKKPWLPCSFRFDFLTVLAFLCSNIGVGMAFCFHLLHLYS